MGKRVCLTKGCVHLQLVASVVLFRKLFKILCSCFISCFETGSYYVTLVVLELIVDQATLELTEILLASEC